MKLLLVDDEEPLRRLLKKHLEGYGFHVVTGENGLEAIALAQCEKPDVVLMDLEMPKMDGVKAIETLRANPITAPLPIILLTGKATGKNVRSAMSAGVDCVLVKSDVKLGEFPEKLRSLVSDKRRSVSESAARQDAGQGNATTSPKKPPSPPPSDPDESVRKTKASPSPSSQDGSDSCFAGKADDPSLKGGKPEETPRSEWPLVPKEKVLGALRKSVELKALPFVATEIIKVSGSARSTAKELADVLQQDQALAAQVIRLANSALYGDAGRVRNLTHAVTKIGFGSVRDMALAVALMDEYQELSLGGRVPILVFWKHSLSSGCLARGLATAARFDSEKADGAFLGGLLHDMGELILSDLFPVQYAQVAAYSLRGEGRLFDLEREAFGIDHCEVAGALLQKWKFSESLIKPITLHHRPWIKAAASGGSEDLRLTAVVRLASALATAWGIGSDGDAMIEDIPDVILKQLGIDAAKIREVLGVLDSQVDDLTQVLLLHGAPPPQDSPPHSGETSLNGNRVAIVSQAQPKLDALSLLLERLGCKVEHLSDVKAAPEAASLDAILVRWNTAEWLDQILARLNQPQPIKARIRVVAVGDQKLDKGRGESLGEKGSVMLRPPFYIPHVVAALRARQEE